MNINEKINRISKLEELVKKQKMIVAKEEKKLQFLEKKLKKEEMSESPILMFKIDETMEGPKDIIVHKYECIYYFPDLDTIKTITTYHHCDYLPNYIDMTEYFKDIDIPTKKYIYRIEMDQDKLDYATEQIRKIINFILATEYINNWNELPEKLNKNKYLKLLKNI